MKNNPFFHYDGKGNNKAKAAGPSELAIASEDNGTLRDWNTRREEYVINGILLADLQKEPFKDIAEFRAFLITHLLKKVKSPQEQEKLCDLAIRHLGQGGLPHAMSINALSQIDTAQGENPKLLLIGSPVGRVEFDAHEEGIVIVEKIRYETVSRKSENSRNPFQKETTEEDYVLDMESNIVLTSNEIKIYKAQVDCPHEELSVIIDPPSLVNKIVNFFKRFIMPPINSNEFKMRYKAQLPTPLDNEETNENKNSTGLGV